MAPSSAMQPGAPSWAFARGRGVLMLDTPRIIAIVNVTPDSFSDGGEVRTPEGAAEAAERHVRDGADALDVGGESTRPGSRGVSASEQIARVEPALRAIRRRVGDAIPITIDTMDAAVARAALDSGADAINDVSGGEADDRMLALAAQRGAGVILMHRRAPSERDSYSHAYDAEPDYGTEGVVGRVAQYLSARADAALSAGIERSRIVLDPGLGFGKSVAQNLALIDRTPEFVRLGFPVLSAASRKSFTARAAGLPAETAPRDRLAPTLALSVLHLVRGARLFRVHDVAPHALALKAAWAAVEPRA